MAVVLLGLVLPAGRAAAHIEVSSESAAAGAEYVVVTFVAEAESQTAGIRAIQVQLPEGLAPADVSWESGPPGWSLTATAAGYEVSGPPVPAGQDATYAVRVRQLPDTPSLAFKSLQHYTDGRIDRWIELPEASGASVENPAPVLTLTPAAPASTETSTSSSSALAPVSPAAGPASSDGGGMPTGVWFGLAALAVVILVLAGFAVLRRGRARTDVGTGG